jgi:glycosyltransferase involved in cell wall biosynthesis
VRVARIIISPYFDPILPGGGNQFSLDLARCWLKKGVEVHVFCSNHARDLRELQRHVAAGKLFLHEICDSKRLLLSHLFVEETYRDARELIERIRPESIHIHNFHGLLGAVWAAVESPYKTFCTVLDFGLICLNWYLFDGSATPCGGPAPGKCRDCMIRQHGAPWWKKNVVRLPDAVFQMVGEDPEKARRWRDFGNYLETADSHLDRMLPLLSRIDGFLTISPITGRILMQFGVPPERIHFHVQGFQNEDISSSSWDVATDEVKLVFLGHLAPIKGFHIVVSALEKLPAGLPLRVYLYGPQAEDFVTRCSSLARRYLSARQTLVGGEVERELLTSEALIAPSLWHENSPYAIVRALAAHRPVIAARQAGVSHLISHRVNGLLLSPHDVGEWAETLCDVATSPQRLRGMREKCSFNKKVETYAAEVDQVIGGSI